MKCFLWIITLSICISIKTNTEPWNMKSVERTMDELHHRYISILKIDVEGSEWTAIAAMLESEKMRLVQNC